MPNQFANFATPLITGGAGGIGTALGATDTTVHVTTGAGAGFPSVYPYQMPIGNPAGGAAACEIVRVTASAGTDAFTIVRAQENTTARSWPVGTALMAGATALVMNALNHTFNIKLFGGKVDGVTDDTAALNAAIAACAAVGGGIVDIGPGVCVISSTIYIGNGSTGASSTINGVTLRGDGIYASSLKWNGASGGVMVQILGLSYGNAVTDLTLDGNNGLAGTGLWITSNMMAHFPSLRVINTTSCALLLDANTTGPAGNQNTMGCHFGKVFLICSPGTNVAQSHGLWLRGGGTSWDTSQCSFSNIEVTFQGNYMTAMRWSLCDNNVFDVVNCYPNPSATGQIGLLIDGTALTNFPASNIVLFGNFGSVIQTTGTPGINWVQILDVNDGTNGAPPATQAGLAGFAAGAPGFSYPLMPFGPGAPVNVPGEVRNVELTVTGTTNVLGLTGAATAGIYQANLYLRLTSAVSFVQAVVYSEDESGVSTSYFFNGIQNNGTAMTLLHGASLVAGSFACVPLTVEYQGSGTPPNIQVNVNTANVVWVSASIIKIG